MKVLTGFRWLSVPSAEGSYWRLILGLTVRAPNWVFSCSVFLYQFVRWTYPLHVLSQIRSNCMLILCVGGKQFTR